MYRLPAVLAVIATTIMAAAAPAAQGRRVLVAVERDAHSPAGGALSGALPDGSHLYLVKVPRGSDAHRFAQHLSRRPHVLATQVNHRLRLRLRSRSRPGCVDTGPSRSIDCDRDERRARRPRRTTKPIAILDTGVDPSVAELAGRALPNADVAGALPGPRSGRAWHGGRGDRRRRRRRHGGVSPTSPVFSVRI